MGKTWPPGESSGQVIIPQVTDTTQTLNISIFRVLKRDSSLMRVIPMTIPIFPRAYLLYAGKKFEIITCKPTKPWFGESFHENPCTFLLHIDAINVPEEVVTRFYPPLHPPRPPFRL